ncbi:NCS1 nucleoside transporter family [Actinomadura coerulea]|uniref:NCS1 nucleoside transporter family n=1 Tax=Actinomadura coerulea TaxID=46159 RepID=A0A7X0L001_9ACTN|nr:cytosine permease [Actinomadura coerulea]MBB6396960.1 NCS1 nucleoside transporter family [Actinomadura coerulea]GGP95632.1 cytosine permease [Actinomadura coerulea]
MSSNESAYRSSAAEPVRLEEPVRFDEHGIDPIPASARDSTPWQQFWIWCGANIAPINWVLGALGVTLGLSLVETLVVITLGNLVGCAVFGLFNVIGHRTGVNQMVLGRGPFGRRGALVPGLVQGLLTMGWVGVNTWVVLDLVIEILAQAGVHGGTGLRYLVAGLIMAAQLLLALYGFYAIRTFEKYTVPVTVLVMVVMTGLAIGQADLHWTTATATTAGDKFTAVTQLLTAIGIGWGISWLPYSADYSRFVRTEASDRSVFWSTALGMYVPTVWLAALGACLASAGDGGDPSSLVTGAFGVMAVPVLLLIMHGPVATNILNLYSCSLAALSVGIRTARWKVTLVAGTVASLVLVVFVHADSFAQAFDHWMASILVWISPWAAIVLVDFFVLRRGRIDVATLYRDGGANVRALVSLALGLVAAWAWQFGTVPALQGPIARTLGHTDFSWLSGALVAGGLHYVLARRAHRKAPGAAPAETVS